MAAWVLTGGTVCGLVGLLSAAALVCLTQAGERWSTPQWLRPGLFLVTYCSIILYGGSLLGSLYIEMTRLVSAIAPR